jgi:hypothetical protein
MESVRALEGHMFAVKGIFEDPQVAYFIAKNIKDAKIISDEVVRALKIFLSINPSKGIGNISWNLNEYAGNYTRGGKFEYPEDRGTCRTRQPIRWSELGGTVLSTHDTESGKRTLFKFCENGYHIVSAISPVPWDMLKDEEFWRDVAIRLKILGTMTGGTVNTDELRLSPSAPHMRSSCTVWTLDCGGFLREYSLNYCYNSKMTYLFVIDIPRLAPAESAQR